MRHIKSFIPGITLLCNFFLNFIYLKEPSSLVPIKESKKINNFYPESREANRNLELKIHPHPHPHGDWIKTTFFFKTTDRGGIRNPFSMLFPSHY